ncbi:MAG: ATP-binding protein [Anaerolineae bacterium]|nr:ATP-binding protein [Anaerolineae bacterium]
MIHPQSTRPGASRPSTQTQVPNQRIVKILVPRSNVRDVLSAELVLSTLKDAAPFGLEIVGTASSRAFQIRGDTDAVKRVVAQIRFAYPQCEFEEVMPQQDAMQQPYIARRVIELRLREGAYLPIRTNVTRQGRVTNDDQAQGADPMIGLLAAMDDLEPGETVLVQCALRAMPSDWSKYWRGSQADIEARTKFSPQTLGGTLALVFGMMLCFFGIGFAALSWFARSVALLPWVIGLLGVGSALVYLRFRLPSPPDPALVKQKTVESAFRVRLRVFVDANSGERADERIQQMLSAFQAYNLAGGNGFVPKDVSLDALPHEMRIEENKGLSSLPVLGLLRSPQAELPVLSTSEVAMLWHLPHGMASLQGMDTPNAKAILPIDADVAEGILIGHSLYQNQRKAVRLSKAMLRGNVGLIAQTQAGKSNLMALAIAQIMQDEPEASVIVLDPHRRLAQALAGLVPKTRIEQAVFLSLADREYPFGLNLLDRLPKTSDRAMPSAERYTDKLVSDVIGSLNEIWPDNWGPRMESFLRWSLLTLGYANEVMVADHAFLEWHRSACARMGYMRERLAANTLTRGDIGGVLADLQAFAALKRPPLGSISREHESLSRLYQILGAGMRDAANRVKSPEALSRLKNLRDLHERLETFAKSGYKRSGISQRIYNNPARPLQYSLLDVTPILLHGDFRQRIIGAVTGAGHRHVDRWWKDSFNVYRDTNYRLVGDDPARHLQDGSFQCLDRGQAHLWSARDHD